MIVLTTTIDNRHFQGDAAKVMRSRSIQVAEFINDRMLSKLKAKLSIPGTGRWYKSKRKDGSRHQASAPGETPAPDRTVYRESWGARIVEAAGFVQSIIGTDLWEVFGRRLEFGGAGGGVYIAPRPHVRPALEETNAEVESALRSLE